MSARTFNGTSCFVGTSPPWSNEPDNMTIACWGYATSLTTLTTMVGYGVSSSGDNRGGLVFGGTIAGDPITYYSDPSANYFRSTTTGYSINTWHHCVALREAGDNSAFIDGGSQGTPATTTGLTGVDRIGIGCMPYNGTNNFIMTGRVAWPAMWDVALTDGEIAALAAGASPLTIRPKNLIWFVPLIGTSGNVVDIIGGTTLTEQSTPGAAEAPPVFLGGAWPANYTPAAGGGATGTSTQNLPSLTQSATGQQPHIGTAAQSLPSLSQAATGAQPFEGSAAQALPAATQAGSGLAGSSAGTSVQTLPAATQSGVGIMQPSATAAQTLPAATQSGTGEQAMVGTAAQTLPATQQAGAGTHGNVHTGTAAQTLPAATQAGTGEQPHAGTGTQTLPSAQQAGAGAQAVAGTATQTLPATRQSGTGAMHPFVVAVQILPSLTQIGSGISTSGGVTVSSARTVTIEAGDRTLTIEAGDRTVTIQ